VVLENSIRADSRDEAESTLLPVSSHEKERRNGCVTTGRLFKTALSCHAARKRRIPF
jgi:hypothetical protein